MATAASAVSEWGFSGNIVVLPKPATKPDSITGVHCTVIVRSKNMLLMIHRRNKEMPWRFIGGKPEQGEALIVAAGRELKEESGLEALNLSFYSVGLTKIDSGLWKGYYFTCDNYIGFPAIQEPEKVDEMAWFAPEDIAALDAPPMERSFAAQLNVLAK